MTGLGFNGGAAGGEWCSRMRVPDASTVLRRRYHNEIKSFSLLADCSGGDVGLGFGPKRLAVPVTRVAGGDWPDEEGPR